MGVPFVPDKVFPEYPFVVHDQSIAFFGFAAIDINLYADIFRKEKPCFEDRSSFVENGKFEVAVFSCDIVQ